MKQLISVLVLITGCTAEVAKNGDDTTVDPTGRAKFATTSMFDERLDQIDFTNDEPVHTHTGAKIPLGGTDCVDVYKYSYLLETPRFGREVTPNPIAFSVTADEFRIRREAEVLADWKPVEEGRITIGRAMLGDREGKYYVDVRTGMDTATTCWNHHPLAAPLDILPAKVDANGLANMKLLLDSPISKLFDSTDVPLFTEHVINYAAEPASITIDITKPVASYTRRAVDAYVMSAKGLSGVICEDANGNGNSDPICTEPNVMPVAEISVLSGMLASPTWSMAIIDTTTGSAGNCTISNLHATCQMPPRTTQAPQVYRIVLGLRNAMELAPAATGPFAEHTIQANTFTGKMLEVERRCLQYKTTTKLGATIVTCEWFVDYTHIQALDSAQVMFATTPITINGHSFDAAAYTWDSGNDDLPGPE